MAKLESIFISGIRSFGINREDSQSIKFRSPLTLFLGQNGCGKTTIIEALKCAITGEFPGGTSTTRSGAGFVSDPYLHHVASVIGQIKLNIKGPNNEKICVTRSMRSDKKNNTIKFSTLDGTLKYTVPGKDEVTMSGRCVDLNNTMIELLRVPKAILNNVIFCHQENSLWPLEDSSKLKQKFDEIFDSAKYTKCVETLRKIHKDKLAEIKILATETKFRKDNQSEVERKKAVLAEKEAKFQEMEAEIEAKKIELGPIVKRVGEIRELEANMLELNSKLATKQSEKCNLEQQQKLIKNQLKKEYTGSDADLQDELKEFNENKVKDEARIVQLEAHKDEICRLETVSSDAVQRKAAMLVQLQEKITQYQHKINERNGLINNMATVLNTTVSSESEAEIVDTINTLSASVRKEKTALDQLSDAHEKTNEDLQKKVDACRNKVIQLEQNIKIKNQQINDLKKESREINSQLSELSVSDDQLKKFHNQLKAVDNDLKDLRETFDPEVASSEIEKQLQIIKQKELTLDNLDREYKILQKNSITENELENNKSDNLKREVDIRKIENKHFDSFNELFGSEQIPTLKVKEKVEQIQIESSKCVNDLQTKITMKEKNITVMDTKYDIQKKTVAALQKDIADGKKQITDVCGTMPYNQKCAETKLKHTKLVKQRGELDAGKIMYEKFIRDMTQNKCCPICDTGFENKMAAINNIVAKLKSKIEMFPTEIKKNNAELSEVSTLHEKCLGLKTVNLKITKLETDISNIEAEIQELKSKSSTDKTALGELKNDFKSQQKKVTVCNKVIADAALIDQYRADIQKSLSKIDTLQSQIVTVKSNLTRQKCESKIDEVKLEISTARQNYDTQQKKLHQNRTRLQSLIDDKNKIKEQQLKLEKLMHGKPQLLDNIEEIKKKQDVLAEQIVENETNITEFQTDLENAEVNKVMAKEENKAALNKARKDLSKNQNSLSDILKLQTNIVSTANEKLDDRFNVVFEEVKTLKAQQDEIKAKKSASLEKITEMRMLLANQESKERRLQDNISLRQKRTEHAAVLKDLKRLNDEIGTKNYQQVMKEKDTLQRRYSEIDREIQQSRGKKEELAIVIEDTKRDLEKPVNKNAYIEYRDKAVEYRVTEEATKNIKTYMDALDNAIVVLHRNRMKQINETVRHLWRQIYRGNDIDYIEIDSGDTDHKGDSSRRVYNYKVMQMKNETMIEMRGRCSAGQKVLACLIIRMALSETFSADCGILALDEPTTNLDRDNIVSLSQSLAKIINTRQGQKNFQLLVITHDEDFIRTLRTVDALQSYYRVSRSNRGTTLITTESI